MNYRDNPERKRVLHQALRARTLADIANATCELKTWVNAHPDDIGIVDAFEQLSLMEDCAREREAENTTSVSILPSAAEPAGVR